MTPDSIRLTSLSQQSLNLILPSIDLQRRIRFTAELRDGNECVTGVEFRSIEKDCEGVGHDDGKRCLKGKERRLMGW